MLPHLEASPPPYSKIGDISGNCQLITAEFSETSLLTRRYVLGVKMLKYVNPSWGNPTPHILI